MLYIDDKARGVHEGYLVTPITRFELVFGLNIAGAIKAIVAGLCLTVMGSLIAGIPTLFHWRNFLGAMLMIVGFLRRSAFVRWQALLLIAATIVKVFVYDVSQLDKGYRIVSFIVLGVLLLAISFVYQRDWLQLSARSGAQEKPEGNSTPA